MKKKKQISFTVLILLFTILILLIALFKTYSYIDTYKDEINSLKEEVKSEKELQNVYKLTHDFIEKSSVGQHGDLLTGAAKENYIEALKSKGISEHKHDEEDGHLDDYDLINTYVHENEDNTATSYAIYKVYYSNNPNSDSINSKRILVLSLTANWEKTNDGYKVFDYKIDLLEDSLDKDLQKMYQENAGDKK
ncbi:hypothetical protein MXL46_14030 [Heyndrickxia sporothermodurans]|uniref:hypothetical protein n=1 Tax=Heyndrickxia sporothermodurans TaxID=46224 RepID=UPI002DB6CFB1|nr:hypothetical protein [Heyndrickxia sporothermodurans]MEB6550210.1 hypothetical protein [Heyndrickxia sporothermodurans]